VSRSCPINPEELSLDLRFEDVGDAEDAGVLLDVKVPDFVSRETGEDPQ